MNSRQIQNDETNKTPVINPFISANTSFHQVPIINNLNLSQNPSNINISQEETEIIKEQNTSKTIEPKSNPINSVPFNSLVKEEPRGIINSSTNINNITSSATVINPFTNRFAGSTVKIELFKSPNQTPLMNKVQVINLNPSKKNKENYKILIKRIASQLRKKIKPPTKGFFYKYINQENERQYKLLVKKIANQLKKRIKFPTSKILKIYESYRILIKRIALALKLSIEKRKNNNQIIQEEKEKFDINVNKIEPIENIQESKKIIEEKSGSKSKKQLKFNIGVMTKEQIQQESGMKIFEEKTDKNEKINTNDVLKQNQNEEIQMNEDVNVDLSRFEINSVNFNNDFNNFLAKVNISIVNNFPVSLIEKNKEYFYQNTFWFLILNYILNLNSNLSIYTILSLLEQYFIWCKDITQENFLQMKDLIKNYISKNFTNEKLNQFLFMNKLKTLDDIFSKFEPHFNNNMKIVNYQEIKIEDLNFGGNTESKCDCDLCKNDEACLKKVIDINKEKIKIIKGQNLDFIGNKDINKPEVNMDIDNGEELYFKGISNKKNKIFTESKTKLSESTNFLYTSINTSNNNIISKEDSDEKNKTFKNISKRKDKIEKVFEEKKSSEKKEDKDDKEEEDIEIITKNKRRGRPKKEKSLIKNKKKDKSKDIKSEEENEEKEEDEKKGKRNKSRKSNRSENSKEDENDGKENKKEKEKEKGENKSRNRKKSRTKKNKKSKKLDDSDGKDNELDDDGNDDKSLKNSRRKKSKTPKNKKSQSINEK